MAKLPTIYDLVLLLSTKASDEDRARLLTEVEATIDQGGGRVEHKQSWGVRPTTFPIDHQAEAQYELLQFSGPTPVLESLSHNLGIADDVLRHRIIKVTPGTPPTPDSPPPLVGAAATGSAGAASPAAPAAPAGAPTGGENGEAPAA